MIKCPACGENSSLHIIDFDTYIQNDIISLFLTYKCDCGRRFMTRTQTNTGSEEMYDIDV